MRKQSSKVSSSVVDPGRRMFQVHPVEQPRPVRHPATGEASPSGFLHVLEGFFQIGEPAGDEQGVTAGRPRLAAGRSLRRPKANRPPGGPPSAAGGHLRLSSPRASRPDAPARTGSISCRPGGAGGDASGSHPVRPAAWECPQARQQGTAAAWTTVAASRAAAAVQAMGSGATTELDHRQRRPVPVFGHKFGATGRDQETDPGVVELPGVSRTTVSAPQSRIDRKAKAVSWACRSAPGRQSATSPATTIAGGCDRQEGRQSGISQIFGFDPDHRRRETRSLGITAVQTESPAMPAAATRSAAPAGTASATSRIHSSTRPRLPGFGNPWARLSPGGRTHLPPGDARLTGEEPERCVPSSGPGQIRPGPWSSTNRPPGTGSCRPPDGRRRDPNQASKGPTRPFGGQPHRLLADSGLRSALISGARIGIRPPEPPPAGVQDGHRIPGARPDGRRSPGNRPCGARQKKRSVRYRPWPSPPGCRIAPQAMAAVSRLSRDGTTSSPPPATESGGAPRATGRQKFPVGSRQGHLAPADRGPRSPPPGRRRATGQTHPPTRRRLRSIQVAWLARASAARIRASGWTPRSARRRVGGRTSVRDKAIGAAEDSQPGTQQGFQFGPQPDRAGQQGQVAAASAVQQGVDFLDPHAAALQQGPVDRRAVQENPGGITALENTPQAVQLVGVTARCSTGPATRPALRTRWLNCPAQVSR